MDIYSLIDLEECPVCGGVGCLEEEYGWAMYVMCVDCGCRTAEMEFHTDDEKLIAARQVGHLWNIGKVVSHNPGE